MQPPSKPVSAPFAPKILYAASYSAGLVRRARALDCDHLAFAAPELSPQALAPALAAAKDLKLLLDLSPGRIPAGHPAAGRGLYRPARLAPGWHPDPRVVEHDDLLFAAREDPRALRAIEADWGERLSRLAQAGVAGFRCLDPGDLPAESWAAIITAARARAPGCRFVAWTPGSAWEDFPALAAAGFDAAVSSLPWWDGRADWFFDENRALGAFPAILAPARAPGQGRPPGDGGDRLRLAAATGDGLFLTLDLAADDEEIRAAAALFDKVAELSLASRLRPLVREEGGVTALLRMDRKAQGGLVILINPHPTDTVAMTLPTRPLPSASGDFLAETAFEGGDAAAPLAPREVRLLRAARTVDIVGHPDQAALEAAIKAPRIAVEAVTPTVDGGRFPVKRIVGLPVAVEADLVADGHELFACGLLWRPADEPAWRREALDFVVNDRWRGNFTPDRIGPHFFAVEAWWDDYGTFVRDFKRKREAGQELALEIEEGRQMLLTAGGRAQPEQERILREAAAQADRDGGETLLSAAVVAAMAASAERRFTVMDGPYAVEVERPAAGFAAWYELFPRSATDDPNRHGTFDDVIGRLPAIAAMGFDVLYLPPIHPIGTTNRKGRNNSLRAQPGDVGSPYAIGGEAGGHTAVEPRLGGIAAFRRLVEAAAGQGLEIALDFAVQCSPDHPWLKEHPDWFRWRPDGSMRYAENPPKKYEDIVNVDFYAPGAVPDLWLALRDVVRFWLDEGVRMFRVDNPHTKPLPFWEWLIADIRSRRPDAMFLAEAFTRPKLMYRLAKIGFSQSYTYFTWRDTKAEITQYLTELQAPPPAEFFRPHFFVNTPDINPPYLQTGGRPAFLVRACLAATLSGLWGVYSGFELCEAAPVPGKEEYLDSEKYEIRVRDWQAPGNIVGEITALNRIRKAHPVLRDHRNLAFYNADNPQILTYGRKLPGARDMLFVAVNLNPRNAQEAAYELPLWELGLGDGATVAVTDLMSGAHFAVTGKAQRLRLDPAAYSFFIWHIETI